MFFTAFHLFRVRRIEFLFDDELFLLYQNLTSTLDSGGVQLGLSTPKSTNTVLRCWMAGKHLDVLFRSKIKHEVVIDEDLVPDWVTILFLFQFETMIIADINIYTQN